LVGSLARVVVWEQRDVKASVHMGESQSAVGGAANAEARRRLQIGVIAFFAVVALSLVVIYVLRPEVYTQALGARVQATEPHPLIATMFCTAILIFIALLIVGVLRRWRWIYWLLALAFVLSALQVPAGALELAGVLPNPFPAWYTIYRSVIAVGELALGIWLLVVWRRWGVWAEGRRRRG
jgi:hypothetical protein